MNNKIIVALDSSNIKNTINLVKKLKNEVYAFKIGYEFFLNFGHSGYYKIKKICPNIFLDLKLHDIPNTVEKAIKSINKLEPVLTTIHISGGDQMQKAANISKKTNVKIIGVSILTSLNSLQTKKYYNESNIKNLVKKYVKFAEKNKLDGIVCSPLELKIARKIAKKNLLLVVPGIRPKNYRKKYDDQKRFFTPEQAIRAGADFIVIGRPITASKNPLKTIIEINRSIN